MKTLLASLLTYLLVWPAAAWAGPLDEYDWTALLPETAAAYDDQVVPRIAEAAESLEAWAASKTWSADKAPDQVLADVKLLLDAQEQVAELVERGLAQRSQFAALPAGDARRDALCSYLGAMSELIDLSGRMRYLLRDAIDNASYALDPYPAQFQSLLDLLIVRRSQIGAAAMAYVLLDPPVGSGAVPFPDALRSKTLDLIAASRNVELLPQIVQFLGQQSASGPLVVAAAETIRQLGLPQDPLPSDDPDLPVPAITADQLRTIVRSVDPRRLSAASAGQRAALLGWLDQRVAAGVQEPGYRYGDMELRPGDWLLMRNPSPYNLFTDLRPGLFTHVGVVAEHTDDRGRRHLVIVEVPERGDRIPATNVDLYLQRTLHFVFLRHREREVAHRLGETAARIIGNPSQFDLLFRTERVAQLKGTRLEDQTIHTYCAGLLLLCAQETAVPREAFFPIPEYAAGHYCLQNLAQLGLSIGDDFVSPTGAIFSPQLEIVGRREAMYDPHREIRMAIYDHFGESMVYQQLEPSPDTYQALREKVAALSKFNPWLARALASAHGVSQEMDLESAAKAAAVIETLDEIADGQAHEFSQARQAFLVGPLDQPAARQLDAAERQQILAYRQRHAQLFQHWTSGQLSPRALRIELVDYYTRRGQQQLNQRFFPGAN